VEQEVVPSMARALLISTSLSFISNTRRNSSLVTMAQGVEPVGKEAAVPSSSTLVGPATVLIMQINMLRE